MAIIRVIFIFFALGGITAFLAFSVKPILFWLQNGYWSLANPPKMILLGICFLAFHTAIGLGGLLFLHWREVKPEEKLRPKHSEQQWLNKNYWSNPKKQSTPILSLDLMNFAVRYYAIISLLPLWVIYESIQFLDYDAMLGLIFPAFALFLYMRQQSMLQYAYKYKTAYLKMTSYPAIIGKHCSGILQFSDDIPEINYLHISLRCLLRSNNNQLQQYEQKLLWQRNQDIEPKVLETKNSTENTIEQYFEFSFNLENGLKESQTIDSLPFVAWEIDCLLFLNNSSSLQRNFQNIPVFEENELNE